MLTHTHHHHHHAYTHSIIQYVDTTPAFAPKSKEELQSAVDACLKLCSEGDCGNNSDGTIGKWDVSRVMDMTRIFSSQMPSSAAIFNADVSKWDVSRVTNMFGMFWGAESFNIDLLKWNVSNSTDMDYMFFHSAAFNSDISK